MRKVRKSYGLTMDRAVRISENTKKSYMLKYPPPACTSDDRFTEVAIAMVLGLSIIALIMLLGLMNYYFLVQVFSGRFIAS